MPLLDRIDAADADRYLVGYLRGVARDVPEVAEAFEQALASRQARLDRGWRLGDLLDRRGSA